MGPVESGVADDDMSAGDMSSWKLRRNFGSVALLG